MAAGALLGVLCVVLIWAFSSLPAVPQGGILFRFAGFTNAGGGAITGQFTVSNAFGYALVCATAAPQVRRTNRWSVSSQYGYPGNPVFTVPAHAEHTFSVALSNVDGAAWRVPLAYDKVPTRIERWSKEIGILLRLPVANNPGGYTNTPEVFGLPNHTAQPTGALWQIQSPQSAADLDRPD